MALDPLLGEYHLECRTPGCNAKRIVIQYQSCGWKIGMRIPHDPSDPWRSACFKCKFSNLYVKKIPVQPPPPEPEGFSKIPTE